MRCDEVPGLDVIDWFDAWMQVHRKLFPAAKLPDPRTAEGQEVYFGWIEALAAAQATADLARQASRRLQARPPRRDRHLEAVLAEVESLRRPAPPDPSARGAPAGDGGRGGASLASRDCPECSGTGWARRPVPHPAADFAGQTFRLSLFCRCPLGREFRRDDDARDARREREREIAHGDLDDLQARPDLWDPGLSHPTWSPVPAVERRWASRTEYLTAAGEAPAKPKRRMA